MAYKTREQQNIASKKHYELNKQDYLDRNRRYRKELNEFMNKIKESTPCTDCAISYPYYVMDFDHLDSTTKKGLISYFCKTGRTAALRDEIRKCELVCANCHRKRTHKRQQELAKTKKSDSILVVKHP